MSLVTLDDLTFNHNLSLLSFTLHSTGDGHIVVFKVVNPKAHVAYVDVFWAITRYGNAREESTEFRYRMNKVEAGRWEHQLRYSEVDPMIQLGQSDILRYYFSYWVLPEGSTQGVDCETEVHWFASPRDALNQPTPSPTSPTNTRPAPSGPSSASNPTSTDRSSASSNPPTAAMTGSGIPIAFMSSDSTSSTPTVSTPSISSAIDPLTSFPPPLRTVMVQFVDSENHITEVPLPADIAPETVV